MIDETHRRWVDSMPAAYEQWLAPAVFRPFAVDLARRISSLRPHRVLELAAGSGVLTRELLSTGVSDRVVATDLNAAMVEFGRRHVPGATWREADAMQLPFGAGEFDVVASQFGVMFFPDKVMAFAEARRVLTAHGTLIFSTWADLASHEFETALVAVLGRVFPADPPTFFAAIPHGYPDPGVISRDLRAAGFSEVTVETLTLEGRATSAAHLATGYCEGTPLRAALESRADLATATALIAQEMEAELGAGEVTGRMAAHVVTAVSGTQER